MSTCDTETQVGDAVKVILRDGNGVDRMTYIPQFQYEDFCSAAS